MSSRSTDLWPTPPLPSQQQVSVQKLIHKRTISTHQTPTAISPPSSLWKVTVNIQLVQILVSVCYQTSTECLTICFRWSHLKTLLTVSLLLIHGVWKAPPIAASKIISLGAYSMLLTIVQSTVAWKMTGSRRQAQHNRPAHQYSLKVFNMPENTGLDSATAFKHTQCNSRWLIKFSYKNTWSHKWKSRSCQVFVCVGFFYQ